MRQRRRFVLHVDLEAFFVSVERSLDPALRGRPVVVGGDGQGHGFVAAASEEARAAGIRVGLPVGQARQLLPDAVFRRGDLETYGRVSEDVTAVLLAASRRVERPSADEAFVDLSPEQEPARGATASVPPVRAAETIRDELQRRLGLDASLGLASTRLAARAASSFARPRGLLVVLPGYEGSFVAPRPVSLLGLPPHVEAALERAGLTTVGQVADAEPQALSAIVGPTAAQVGAAARGEDEPEIALAAPPAFLQEEAVLRDRKADPLALLEIAEAVARRAARRLRPLRLNASAVTLELRRSRETVRRTAALTASGDDPDAIAAAAHSLAASLVDAAGQDPVRGLVVRLSKLQPRTAQTPLFPSTSAWSRAL